MALDGIAMHALCEELSTTLCGGKLQKVYQPEKDELVFHIYANKTNYKLFIGASGSNPRMHVIEEDLENPATPHAFCMLLRKHIQGGKISEIKQLEYERLIEIYFENLDELGFSVNKKLVIEIMGRHSNAVLVDIKTGKILDAMKRISLDTSRVRQLLPGLEYVYPPAQDKLPIDKISSEDILKALENEKSYAKALSKTMQGIGPMYAESLCYGLSSDNEVIERLRKLKDDLTSKNFSYCVYMDNESSAKDFYMLPMAKLEKEFKKKEFDSFSKCINYYYKHQSHDKKLRQKSDALTSEISHMLEKMQLKIEKLKKDIEEAKNSEHLRLYGELLTANLHMAKSGDTEIKVISYYDGSEVTIPLDARFSPSKNAQNYYKKYGKSKTAIKEKGLQLEETKKDIDYLESVLLYASDAETEDEIGDLRDELFENGYIKKRPVIKLRRRSKPEPISYVLPSGMNVVVGKNNKENDYLTTKLAKHGDLWLHTKDIPGSHVILKTAGKEPKEADILGAASIAAFHSKAKNSENVPVDYVPIKLVKKPAGAKAGMVIFTGNRTVYVSPMLPT